MALLATFQSRAYTALSQPSVNEHHECIPMIAAYTGSVGDCIQFKAAATDAFTEWQQGEALVSSGSGGTGNTRFAGVAVTAPVSGQIFYVCVRGPVRVACANSIAADAEIVPDGTASMIAAVSGHTSRLCPHLRAASAAVADATTSTGYSLTTVL